MGDAVAGCKSPVDRWAKSWNHRRRGGLAVAELQLKGKLNTRRLVIMAVLCAVACPGCSFLFVQQAPPESVWPRLVWASCTDSLAAPAVDGIVAASNLLAASNSKGTQGVTPFLVTGAIATGSAIWGWLQTSRCGELRAYMEQRAWGVPPMPAAAPTPPPEPWAPPPEPMAPAATPTWAPETPR